MEGEAKPIGFDSVRLAVVDLAREIGALDGHVLRVTRTTVVSGGSYAAHSHAGRPEIICILEGALTDIRDGIAVQHGPGSVLQMTEGVTHALANRTDQPVTYISVTVRVP